MAIRTLDEVELAGKRVFIRVDFNVPIEDGKVRAYRAKVNVSFKYED